MGKKYLDTKQNSLESSIQGVWKQAVEDSEEINDAVQSVRMDGRTRSYREHRTKLEAARARRDANRPEITEDDLSDQLEGVLDESDVYDKDRYLIKRNKAILDNPKRAEKDGPNHVWATSAKEALAKKEEVDLDETNKNDVSDDGEGLDAVQKDAVKKKFKDRKDKDIDNDGDVDDSDKYLHNRRKTVTKAVAKDEAYEMGTDEYREYLEKLTPGEDVDKEWEQAKYFKIQSMREALAKVWGLDEYITKEGARKKVNGGDNRRTEKEAHKPGHEEDDEEEKNGKNGKNGKKGKADTGTGKPAAIEIDPTIKASKGY